MKRCLLLSFSFILALTVNAQSWQDITSRRDIYLFGEGRGETVDEADANALANLISQISIVVSKDVVMTGGETISTSGASSSSTFESKIRSFSSATLNNTERLVIQPDEPDVVVGRYIKRADIDAIFKARRDKIKEYVSYAVDAEEKVAIDNSLRYLYWSFLLLNTLPNPNAEKYTTGDGKTQILATWIPQQMDRILDGIDAKVIKKSGNDLDILFTYNGQAVSSLDYTFFDGRDWSTLYSAKDGRGVIELMPGTAPEIIKFKYEYRYEGQAKLYDKEVAASLTVQKGQSFKRATKPVRMESQGDFDLATSSSNSRSESAPSSDAVIEYKTHIPAVSTVSDSQKKACNASLKRVLSAITSKSYQTVQDCFTADGYDVFQRLIKYGNARILQQKECEYSMLDNQIVARSIPMSFNFKSGAVKSFVEDVVFTFNPDGKIDNITFGLGEVATNDIMGQKKWKEEVRFMIINFLEVYKTAFALKRLDYIESVFDDHAVIVSGKIVFRKNGNDADRYAQNKYVQLTRYTKSEYLKHLDASFKSKEFINIRFANTSVRKATGQEVYGIQLRQDYFSSNYGDSGYLYLQVDLTNPKEPVIKVRTWQEEIDPTVGRPYGMEDF